VLIHGKRLTLVVAALAIAAFCTRLLAAPTLEAERADMAQEQTVLLTAMPTSCVALHRGQQCYQRIQLSWLNAQGERYCLFVEDSDTLLYCSSGAETFYLHDYSSKTSESYSLRLGEQGEIVSSVTVSTAWVYRTGRRSSSGWRLF